MIYQFYSHSSHSLIGQVPISSVWCAWTQALPSDNAVAWLAARLLSSPLQNDASAGGAFEVPEADCRGNVRWFRGCLERGMG